MARLRLFRSFTLGMQSGAFVQLLVVLAGMASRIRMLCIDLDEALCVASSSLKQFLSLDDVRVLTTTLRPTLTLSKKQPLNPASPMVPDILLASPAHDESAESELIPSELVPVTQVIRTCLTLSSSTIITHLSSARIRKGRQIATGQKAKNVVSMERTQPRVPKKVKSRKPRDEIDDIFSFTN